MDSTQLVTVVVAVVLLAGAGLLAGIGARSGRDTQPRNLPSLTGTGDVRGTKDLGGAPTWRARFSRRGGRPARQGLRDLDVGLLCAEIATRLEAGASIENAWSTTLHRLDARLDFSAIEAFVAHPRPGLRERFDNFRAGRAAQANPLARVRHPEAAAQALRGMLIATQVATQVGAPLAEILNRVADGIAATLETAAKRHTAQVGPKATARLLGVLPLAALGMAQFIGVDVIDMAFRGGINTWVFVVGLALMVVGNLWSAAMIRKATGITTPGLDPTLAMDIIAACQQNGVSLTSTLQAVSVASEEPDLAVVARMLLLGADWDEAWAQADAKWIDLASVLQPAWEEGASPVPLLVRGASRTRAAEIHQALDAAERLGVRLMIPLGVCLLPAFFALGIVPVVVSTIEDLIS